MQALHLYSPRVDDEFTLGTVTFRILAREVNSSYTVLIIDGGNSTYKKGQYREMHRDSVVMRYEQIKIRTTKTKTKKAVFQLTNNITKLQALANHLGLDHEDIEDIEQVNDTEFEFGNSTYNVCTDEEADEHAREYIIETAWAFNIDFIIEHSSMLDYDDTSRDVVKTIQEKCGNVNDMILKFIDDIDTFVQEAIRWDGRGHFLSSYDGNENEQDGYFIYRTN